MTKGIAELIAELGNENINYQVINQSIINIEDKKKTNDTEITFATNELSASDVAFGQGKTGLILWVDADMLEQAVNKINEG